MDEHDVRTLLRRIADVPEPPSAVDPERARRSGRRWLWVRRCAAPALAMVAVAAIVAVPPAIISSHSERRGPTPQTTSASPPPVSAPSRFNPLVPYAAFGWLPTGFSESAANGIAFNSGLTATTDSVTRQAADNVAGHFLYLDVSARGSCAMTGAQALREVRVRHYVQVSCDDASGMGFESTSAAPDVNGRPALWLGYGSGIAWEYAPGAWASITAQITPAADEPHSRRWAAMRGWILMPRDPADRLNGVQTRAQIQAAIRAGRLIPPPAATRELLAKIAGHVAFGQSTPLEFAFRLPGPFPAGWKLTQASFTVSGDRLIGGGLTFGPAVDPTALGVGAGLPDPSARCNFFDGQSSYVVRDGIQFVYRVLSEPDKIWQTLCTTGTVNGLTPSVALDMNIPGSNNAIRGSVELGGALGVLSRMRFLGVDPAHWTTSPVG